MLVVLLGLSWNLAIGRGQPADADGPGVQVLTRGPVHEAFAGMVTFNPEPGIVVAKAPPEAIEEMPPEERPEGDNVAWIPGYWAWDDERNDFLWISGTWRALPPGRAWMAGYWGPTREGYQWTSGYWADATENETTYLPAPPATVEIGPNIAAPSMEYGWTPGCWVWFQGRYAWRAGYWAQGRADWAWTPAHYVWTPRGYIFVDGFWDYPLERRGVLFAPVYFGAEVQSRRDYNYSPTIVIDLALFTDNLFLRPSYQHYYYGDYYDASYDRSGFYTSASFRSSRSGYDSFYSHQRWEHRQDREWEQRVETAYQDRRNNEAARPPRTWAAQININQGAGGSNQNRMVVALSIGQLAKRTDSPLRFQPVAREERQTLVQRGQEVRKSRDQRQTLEVRTEKTAPRSGAVNEPVKVQLPRSPIVARPANQLGGNQAPPKAPQAPKPDLKIQPKAETPSRPPSLERGNPQSQPRKLEPDDKPTPARIENTPRERQVQPEPQTHAKDPAVKAPDQSQRTAKDLEEKAALQASDRQAKDEAAKSAQDAQRNARDSDRKAQQDAEQRAKDAALKADDQSQRAAKDLETKAQQVSDRQARDAAAKSAQDAQRNARDSDRKAQQEAEQRAKDAAVKARDQSRRNPKELDQPAAAEKGAAKSAKDVQQNDGKEKPSPPEGPPEPKPAT